MGRNDGRKKKKIEGIYGFNIYEDEKGRIIYNDILTKNAVYIPTFDYKQFTFYKYRYILTVSTFIVLQTLLVDMFELNALIPFVITILVWLTMEYKFRKFLKEKQPVKHFDKTQCKGYFDVLNSQDTSKMFLKAILYVALGVLLVLNAYQKAYAGFVLLFCWGIAVVCIFYAVLQVVAYSKRKK